MMPLPIWRTGCEPGVAALLKVVTAVRNMVLCESVGGVAYM